LAPNTGPKVEILTIGAQRPVFYFNRKVAFPISLCVLGEKH